MSRRSIISLAASVIIGIGCIAMISTDAFAYRGGYRGGAHRAHAYHGGAYRGAAYRGAAYRGGVYRGAPVARGVAVGVGAAAVGAAAAGAYIPRLAADTIPTHRATRIVLGHRLIPRSSKGQVRCWATVRRGAVTRRIT
jgi:hypothetical protein